LNERASGINGQRFRPERTPNIHAHARPSFLSLGVPADLLASLAAAGISEPFPIQTATLPDSLAGRDVLGRGQTGSGKTIAFALPTVVALASQSTRPARAGRTRALILVPTRELANQVVATVEPLAKVAGLRTATVYGGVSQAKQVSALRRGVDILVACPGRLEDLIRQGHAFLDDVQVTVLDEADHMADLGFLPGVKRLLDLTPRGGQRLLFSATLDNGVDVLVRRYLVDPVTHSVDSEAAPVPSMDHHVFAVSHDTKAGVVRELASGRNRTLLFTRTKHGARKLARSLTTVGIPAVDLHGNLNQNARERNLAAFSDGTVNVLVATDIAARGIHVDGIDLVVHVDPPAEHKAYLHRSGRTARAGSAGTVVTVVTPDQHADVRQLTKRAGIKALAQPVSPGDAAIVALVGPPADRVAPRAGAVATGAHNQRSASRGQARRHGAARRTQAAGSDPSSRGSARRSAGTSGSVSRSAGGKSSGGKSSGGKSSAKSFGAKSSNAKSFGGKSSGSASRRSGSGSGAPRQASAADFSSRGPRRGGRRAA
jgi:superfamily II DNA/RNA helicase